jgi:hypothetical protein
MTENLVESGAWGVERKDVDFAAWFKRRLQLRAAGVDARGVPMSPFAQRKHVLSRPGSKQAFFG